MAYGSTVLKNDEKAILEMRELYQKYGYTQYKMSKFEEYDLYVRNKDFLVSDHIITFTDTSGKLMALKPDVTLSIIKNGQDKKNSVEKVYYNENVYRVTNASGSFQEIMQVGLECMGDIDDYCIYEVMELGAKSLKNISPDYVLNISHLDIVSAVMDALALPPHLESNFLKCLSEKNAHGIAALCRQAGADPENAVRLVATYGSPQQVLPVLRAMELSSAAEAIAQLERITSQLEESGCRINIDFSVINDINYYNGFVFKGFINGISQGVLSGGQYNKLMQKMNRTSGAVGFAVYLNLLERLAPPDRDYDVDTVILYDDSCSIGSIRAAIKLFSSDGKRVTALRSVPDKLTYKQLLRMQNRGVEILENDA